MPAQGRGSARRLPLHMPVRATVQRGPVPPRSHRRGLCLGVLIAFALCALGNVCEHLCRRVAVGAGQPPGRREGRKLPVEREAGCAPGGRAMRAPSLARARPFVQRGSLFLCVPPEG
jgi:hypothetical protein